jgi:Leucine-rich repeat (LRR) protein
VQSFANLPASLRQLRLKSNEGKENSLTRQTQEVDYLPQYLRSLAIDTRLQDSAHLSASLSGLCVAQRRPRMWPSRVKALRITSASVGDELPVDLTSLELVAVDSRDRPELAKLPANLKRLRLGLVEGDDLALLPRGLTVLDISGSTSITSLSELPPGLLSLDVSQVPLADFHQVPGSVKELIATSCSMAIVTDVPASVESLNLAGCDRLSMIDNLPANLVELNVGKTNLTSLPNLSGLAHLKRLDISNTRLDALPALPQGLEELTLSLGGIHSLKGLPSSVKKLRFIASPYGPREDEEGCPAEPSLQQKKGAARAENICGEL